MRNFLIILLLLSACVNHQMEDPISCESDVVVTTRLTSPNTSCSEPNGSFEIILSDQHEARSFSVNGAATERLEQQNLPAGLYLIEVTDRCGIIKTSEITVPDEGSDLTVQIQTSANSGCLNPNGQAQINIAGGRGPYQMIFQKSPRSDNSIGELREGTYSIAVQDANNCIHESAFTIERLPTGVSWSTEIAPIIKTYCAKSGCHIENTGRVDFTEFSNVKSYANVIRTKTQNKSMPYDGPLPENMIRLIACWVDDGATFN